MQPSPNYFGHLLHTSVCNKRKSTVLLFLPQLYIPVNSVWKLHSEFRNGQEAQAKHGWFF